MKSFIAIFALALGACAVGQGEVSVSSSDIATFPGAGVPVPAGESVTTDASVMLDFQSDLKSLSDLGTLSGTISQNSISGPDLSLIRHIRATIAAKDDKLPEQVASDVDVPEASTQIELPLLISDAQVLAFLAEGQVIVHVYLTGDIPEQPFHLTYTLIAQVTVGMRGAIPGLSL